MISVLVPSLSSRGHWLERLERSLQKAGGDLEILVALDQPSWGVGCNLLAEDAKGEYLLLASDDHEYLPGWWEAATKVCDEGKLPAPLVLNSNGTIQSAGGYGSEAQEDGAVTTFPRIPFLSRDQWDLLGPLLPIHYADPYLGEQAAKHGIETIVTYGFHLVHHFAPEGRLDYDEQEAIRLQTEAAL